MNKKVPIATIEDIINDFRNGKMIVLVDAEDRENEGDLVIPAQMATPAAINFMAKYGRGLICLALDESRANQLALELMLPGNRSRQKTAFTISIEAREGVSTGISAHDRAHTISVAIDPTKGAADIVSPGHVFPLVARPGGTLVRAGHTEAAVDLARLAGLLPAGVICEIMNDDGTMARLPDLMRFAEQHDLKLGTIADLIAYRRRYDTLVSRVYESDIVLTIGGHFKTIIFRNVIENEEHIAFIKGDISGDEPVLVRMHAENILPDLFGSTMPGTHILSRSLQKIADEGRGVLVLIRNTSSTPFTDALCPPDQQDKAQGDTKIQSDEKGNSLMQGDDHRGGHKDDSIRQLKEYGIGAQIIANLGLHKIELLSDTPRKIVGLEGYDIEITAQRSIFGDEKTSSPSS